MRNYRKIKAWSLADDLTVAVYGQTKNFPVEERYALTSQLRRAAHSVPANIAEGASRRTQRDYLHFLYIARGSLAETDYFIHLATRLEYFTQLDKDSLQPGVDETRACLIGLIQAVEKEVGPLKRSAAKLSAWFVLTFPLVSCLHPPVSSLHP